MVGLHRLMMKHIAIATTLTTLAISNAQALTTSTQVPNTGKVEAAAKPGASKAQSPKAPAKKEAPSKGDVLFEGYSKILMGDKHIGYTVQRFEFDSKKKEYSTVYYLKTAPPANDVIESLKARSTFDLKPISYQYTELSSGKPHIVDAAFGNGTMVVTELLNGKRTTKPAVKIPPGTFLASFLGYLMLQQKDSVKVGNKYSYQAIAEEDGNLYKGEAYVKSQEQNHGLNTFKILNTYKGVQFISWMTPQGEVIATDSAAQGISTELAPNIQEATKGMGVNSNQLAQLFGSVPKGQDNALSRHSQGEPLGSSAAGSVQLEPATAPAKTKQEILQGTPSTKRTKQEGVPQGQGIEVKSTEGQ